MTNRNHKKRMAAPIPDRAAWMRMANEAGRVAEPVKNIESSLAATSRVLFWVKYVHENGKFPYPLLFNSYPGVIYIGMEDVFNAYYNPRAAAIDAVIATNPAADIESLQLEQMVAPPTINRNDPPLNVGNEEEAFYNEIFELVRGQENSLELFNTFLLENFSEAAKESTKATLDEIYLNFEKNKRNDGTLQLLGTGLKSAELYNYIPRLVGHIETTGRYINNYIDRTNIGAGDPTEYIDKMPRPLDAFDQMQRPFNALCIALVSHDDDVLHDKYGPVNMASPSLIPLRHIPYIQESIREDAQWYDYYIPGRNVPSPREVPFYHLTGYGSTCLNRLQFTILITEPSRIRNLSGIIAYNVSKAAQTAEAWASNYASIVASMEGKSDAEQLFLYELQSALFELQEDMKRNDWWTKPATEWLTDPTVRWKPAAHQSALLRALRLTAAKFTVSEAVRVYILYAPPALNKIPLRLLFIAAPDGDRSAQGQDPDLTSRVGEMQSELFHQYGIPEEDYNVAASDLLRAQKSAVSLFRSKDGDMFPYYSQFIPYFVFPHIHELNNDIPGSRETQYKTLDLFGAGSAFIEENYRRNLRHYKNARNLPVPRGTPSYTNFLRWLSANFWRLNPAADGMIYCCIVSHPGFMQTLLPSGSPPVVPLAMILKNVDFYIKRETGAVNVGRPAPVTLAAPAPAPNRGSQLPTALNRIQARAAQDPNAAYKEFRDLIPQFAVNLAPAKQAVNSIQPRRRGLFRSQNRNTYRRNLLTGLNRIRQTLRLSRDPRARRKMFSDNLGRLLTSRNSAASVIAKTRKLVNRGGPYENLGPVVNPYLDMMSKPPVRSLFDFRGTQTKAWETGVRTSLTGLRESMQRGGRRQSVGGRRQSVGGRRRQTRKRQ